MFFSFVVTGSCRWRHVAFWSEGSRSDLSLHSRLLCRNYRSLVIKALPTSPIGRDPPADRWLRPLRGIKRVIFSGPRWASCLQSWRGLRELLPGHVVLMTGNRGKRMDALHQLGAALAPVFTRETAPNPRREREIRCTVRTRARIEPVHEGRRRRRCGLKRGHLIADAVWDA